jgi:hypothetical protein
LRTLQSRDPTGQFLLERWPRRGRGAFPAATPVVVEDGERALLCSGDRVERAFGPGHHGLEAGVEEAYVVFLRPGSAHRFLWGTAQPVAAAGQGDAAYRGHGRLTAEIADESAVALVLAGSAGLSTQSETETYLRTLVLDRLPGMAAEPLDVLALRMTESLSLALPAVGLALVRFEVLAFRRG